MQNIKLTLAYDGTNYSGWQIQPNGVTIQELVQNAIRRMTGEKNNILGAGRTDAGVHALAQVAGFKTEKKISTGGFRKGLNSYLPLDIRVVAVEEVDASFHPMRDSKGKHYSYLLSENYYEHPLRLNRVWCVCGKLDIKAMNRAAKCLVGDHDFSAFRASDGCDDNPVRTIFSASIAEVAVDEFGLDGQFYKFDIKGNGFLKNMVRNIVGTIVDVGMHRTTPAGFKKVLESKDRKKAGACAPPCGLYLVSVEY